MVTSRSFWKLVGGPWKPWMALFSPCNPCQFLGLILAVLLCYVVLTLRTRMCVLDKCCPTFSWPPSAATSCSFLQWFHSHLAFAAGAPYLLGFYIFAKVLMLIRILKSHYKHIISSLEMTQSLRQVVIRQNNTFTQSIY